MRWLVRKPRRPHDWPVGYTYLTLGLVGGMLAILTRPTFPIKCLSKLFLGLPCPTCGLTRQVNCLMDGRMLDAFFYNPGTFALICAATAYMISDVVGFHRGWKPVITIADHRLVFNALLIAGTTLNWIYLVATGI